LWFCSNNILYPKEDREQKVLLYACRNCDHQVSLLPLLSLTPPPPPVHHQRCYSMYVAEAMKREREMWSCVIFVCVLWWDCRKLQTTTVCTGTKFFTVQMKEPKCSKMSHLILLSLAPRACDVPNANMVKLSFSRSCSLFLSFFPLFSTLLASPHFP
jgi:hypothetical protein